MRKRLELIRLAYDDKIEKMEEFLEAHVDECFMLRYKSIDVLLYALLRKQFKTYALLN